MNGGHVTGIIPSSLVESEEVLKSVDECHVVADYHTRKALMFSSSDGIAAFPGGPGTLEELVEQLAWAECGDHEKPIYIVNIGGYWDSLLSMFETIENEFPATQGAAKRYTVVNEPKELIASFLER